MNLLIAAGADVNFRSFSKTALMEAATHGQYDCLTLLIAARADVNSPGVKVNETLLSTVSNRMKNVLRAIVNVNVPRNNHVTPLMLAAMFSHNNCVEKLIDAGADVNATTESGVTALMLATTRISESTDIMMEDGKDVRAINERWGLPPKAPKRSHSECIEMLIRAGADVNATNSEGLTPVMAATYYDNCECFQVLVVAGADVNKLNNNGRSALTIAIESGYSDSVHALVEAGADVNSSNKKGFTPLMIAAENGCNDKCINILLNKGADVNKQNHDGFTALMLATLSLRRSYYKSKHYLSDSLKSLIAAGANLNLTNNKGQTALAMLMVSSSSTRLLQPLIQAGADVNIATSDGKTPLILATLYKHFLFIKELLSAGSLINKKDSKGQNALDNYMAWSPRRPSILMLLYAAGEIPSPERAKALATFLQFKTSDELNLKHICRDSIRKHLLDLDPHRHLFGRIPKLGLPSSLVQYLLYHCSLHS